MSKEAKVPAAPPAPQEAPPAVEPVAQAQAPKPAPAPPEAPPAPEPPSTGPYKWRVRKSKQFAPGASPWPNGMRRGPDRVVMTRAGVFYDCYDSKNDWMEDFPEFFELFDTTPTLGGTVPRKPHDRG